MRNPRRKGGGYNFSYPNNSHPSVKLVATPNHASKMSSNPKSTSMASVWDTLNKMKARQAKVLSKTPRQSTTHRKDAIALFENELSSAAERGETDGKLLMKNLEQKLAKDEHARAVIDEHRQRVLSNPKAEIKALERVIADTSSKLSVASASLKRADDIAYKMKLDLGN